MGAEGEVEVVALLAGRRTASIDAAWETAPSYRVPHPSVLLGAAGLMVALFALVPMMLLGQIRPGQALAGFLILTVLDLLVAAVPLLFPATRGTVTVVVGLAVANLVPLAISFASVPGAPVQVWANLLIVPTLIMAASADRLTFHWQLAIAAPAGTLLILSATSELREGAGSSAIFLWVLGTCAFLTRRAWTQVQQRFTALHENSHRDDLTGLYNRRGLLANFPQLRAETLVAGEHLGILMIDIDHFTVINDEHGHPYGDEVLTRICELVTEHSPGEALIARIGGEELVVLVPGPAEPVAVALHTAITFSNIHPGLTVSIGIVDADPHPCHRIDQLWALIHLADSAMYLAKQNGRDRIVRLVPSAEINQTSTTDQNELAARAIPVATGSEPTGRHAAPASRQLHGPGTTPAAVRFVHRSAGHSGNAMAAQMARSPFHRLGVSTGTTPTDQADPGTAGPAAPIRLPMSAPLRPVAPYRLLGMHYLLMSLIGAMAYLIPLAVDPAAQGVSIFLAVIGLLAALGALNLGFGGRLPSWLRLLPLFCAELAVVVSLPTVPELDLRLTTFGLIQVPLLIAAEMLSRRALLVQFPMVLVVAAAAAYQPDVWPALWVHHTVALTALICVPSGILFWLRQRCLKAELELGLLGSLDPLTGLANRFGLQEALVPNRSAPSATNLTPRPLYLIQANINGFKLLNDHYGHGFGDEALQVLAQTLSAVVQQHSPQAVVARTAGDRFLVAQLGLPDIALFTAVRLAVAQMPLAFTVSLGQAYGEVSTTTDVWALTSAAERDLALHKK